MSLESSKSIGGNSGVDALVREYLILKGYEKAAAELLNESKQLSSENIVKVEKPNIVSPGIKEGDEATATTHGTAKPNVSQRILAHITEDLYILGLKDGDTSEYISGYDAIRSWALNSIDIAKPYLLSICFPVFVQCYLGLLRLGHEDTAKDFFNTCRGHHDELYFEELQALSSVTSVSQLQSPEFLDSNTFAAKAIDAKFTVKMTSLAYNLLTLFLVQQDMLLITSLINSSIKFQKVEDLVTGGGESSGDAAFDGSSSTTEPTAVLVHLDGYSPGDIISNTRDFPTLSLGVPGTSAAITDLYGTQASALSTTITGNGSTISASGSSGSSSGSNSRVNASAAAAAAAAAAGAVAPMPNMKNDSTYQGLLTRVVHPRSVLANIEARSRKRLASDAIASLDADVTSKSSQVINTLRTSLLGSAVTAAKERANSSFSSGSSSSSKPSEVATDTNTEVGDPLDPSVIFATGTNCYEGLICMHMNSDASQIATGHRDSAVRVWSWGTRDQTVGSSCNESDYDWKMDTVLPQTKKMYQQSRRMCAYERVSSESKPDKKDPVNKSDSDSRSNASLIEFRGHSKPVYGVSQNSSRYGVGEDAYTDRLVLSCSADESIRLWDRAVKQCVGRYNCLSPPWTVAFGPLGYHFAAGNQDSTATVYSTDRTSPLRLLVGHLSDVNCLDWHANATILATGSDDKTVRLWDIRTGSSARLLQHCSSAISAVAVSPLGNLVAAGGENGKVYVWDAASTRPLAVLQGHSGQVHSLSFSMDSTALCSGGDDCSVRVWDMQYVHTLHCKLYDNVAAVTASVVSGNANPSINTSSNASKATAVSGILAALAQKTDISQIVINPRHSFYTKFCPVYYVGYTPRNLLCAGGPFSLLAATASHVGGTAGNSTASSASDYANGNRNHAGSGSGGRATGDDAASERELVNALGISRAVLSSH